MLKKSGKSADPHLLTLPGFLNVHKGKISQHKNNNTKKTLYTSNIKYKRKIEHKPRAAHASSFRVGNGKYKQNYKTLF